MRLDNPTEQLVNQLGYDGAIRALARLAGYSELPPSIEVFLDNSYFAGSFLGERLYPIWRNNLFKIFPNPISSPYIEIAATGSIGGGKSTFCLAGILYDLIKLLYLNNPHQTYQLINSTQIVVAFMNTTLTLSQSVLFNQFKDWANQMPFIKDKQRLLENPKKEFLPHNINLISGSRGSHALGRAVVSAILSELNFQGEHAKNQAFDQYVQVKRRIESRFSRGEGSILPGRMWLDSSRNDETGFLEQHLKHLEKDVNGLVISNPIWDVLGPAGKVKYSGKQFKVFIGDQTREPCIITDAAGIPDELVLDVPIEYRNSFDRDIYGSLRDLAGIATWSLHKFMPDAIRIREAFLLNNPINREFIELDFDNKNEKLVDYVDTAKLDRNARYFMHFDLGIKHDRTGIALVRATGQQVVERGTQMGNISLKDNSYQCDIVLPVIPRPGKEVPISKLKQFVFDLIDRGIIIVRVSADGYQSTNLLQDVRLSGVETDLISLDRTRDAYDYLKNAIMEKRILLPKNKILEDELTELVDIGKKIDHPEKGSKDAADAVTGALWNCYNNTHSLDVSSPVNAFAEVMQQQSNPYMDPLQSAIQEQFRKSKKRSW